MCGISGSVFKGVASPALVERMVSLQQHRGPDAQAVRTFGRAALGANRLRIIDVRGVADQPLANEDETVFVAFNGEIYNFRELRAQLQGSGHTFKTETDTEVLVHLYEEYGADLVKRLRGMFAFAVWDERRERLLLARDRLGIKPLYYSDEGGNLSFASESKTLAGVTGTRPAKLNYEALAGYLYLGWVPSPETIFDGVYELPPGTLLEWVAGKTDIRKWWQPPHRTPNGRGGGNLQEVLADSVQRHIVADVPVGLFLSSGVDSVAIAFLASKALAELQTYTVGFDGEPDETDAASAWARRLCLPHTDIPVTGQEILDSLPKFIAGLDQPTVDGFNTWVVSRSVKQAGITVALSGLGGDELFEGYSTFRWAPTLYRLSRMAHLFPKRARSAAIGLVTRALDVHSVRRGAEAVHQGGWAAAYAAMRAVTSGRELQKLMPDHGRTPLDKLAYLQGVDHADTITQLELRNYLPQQLLRDTDVTSMAHSLEVRVPLLDDEVVRTALNSPVDAGVRRGKALLAGAVDPALLKIASLPKRTFTLPFHRWLKGPLRSTSRDSLDRLAEPDVGLDRWELSSLWDRFHQGRVHWRTIWALTALGLWVDSHSAERP